MDQQKIFKSSLAHYKTNGYRNINSLLRITKEDDLASIEKNAREQYPDPDDYEQRFGSVVDSIRRLDEGFKNFSTPSEITVFRRAGADVFSIQPDGTNKMSLAKVLKGLNDEKEETKFESLRWILEELVNPFEQTLFSEHGYLSTSCRESFVGTNNFELKTVHFQIVVPQGTRAVYLSDSIGGFQGERELVLDRGYQLKLHDIYARPIEGMMRLFVKAEIVPNQKR